MNRIWIPLVGLIALSLVGCSKSSTKSVATVNGDVITLDEFQKFLETKSVVRIRTDNGQVISARLSDSLGLQVMQDLIQQKLVLQMAKDEDLYPTDKDVETEIAFQKKRSSDFVKQLSLAGLTLADIRERIRVDLAREKLVTKNIKVTTADAEKYVKEHPKEFTDPATARCYFILSTTDKKMKDADAELARGQSFNSVAQRMSEAANAKQSQMYPVVAIDSMPGPIKAAVSKKSAGDVTDWIKMPEGWFKLYVNEKTAEKQRVLDDTMIEAVRRSMALSKGSVAREIGRTLLQKFKQAKVKVEYDPLRAPYDDFDKRLKDAQPDDIEKAINGG